MNLLEAGLLFKVASLATGNILEIGTCIGGSSVLLAAASGDRKVYSVDIVSCSERDKNAELVRLCPTDILNKIEFIVERSAVLAKRWDKKMGLIFIDGSHNPPALCNDILSWKSHVSDSGYMVFHDVGVPTTKKGAGLAKRLLKVVKRNMIGWRKVDQVQSLLVMQKL